jgi:hypothetical protein
MIRLVRLFALMLAGACFGGWLADVAYPGRSGAYDQDPAGLLFLVVVGELAGLAVELLLRWSK